MSAKKSKRPSSFVSSLRHIERESPEKHYRLSTEEDVLCTNNFLVFLWGVVSPTSFTYCNNLKREFLKKIFKRYLCRSNVSVKMTSAVWKGMIIKKTFAPDKL